MLNSVFDLIKSNKFKVAFFSVLALVCTAMSGQMPWADVIDKAWPIVVAYLGAQGLADFGKNKLAMEQQLKEKAEVKDKGTTGA